MVDELYGAYAHSQDAKSLSSIEGTEALSDRDKIYLRFGEGFREEIHKCRASYEKREDRTDIINRMGPSFHLPERQSSQE